LQGPPVVRAFANLPAILEATTAYRAPGRDTSLEVSCYTDPLSLEHLTGSLAECIRLFGTQTDASHYAGPASSPLSSRCSSCRTIDARAAVPASTRKTIRE